ncbi:DUF6230 family protein [Humibacter ginsenosidimutans]|uniref:Cholesterol esterase n=1 Tax=Humibacter ginsenosidimutans TaxID=2599293 RepID=A0A5B8M1B5_9MICO|nr:DUF6230 family protein [Humibacter ginsenosidimutans]QDZ14467.1 cholesterol esterase [Humibacter ginsenosidimutans]
MNMRSLTTRRAGRVALAAIPVGVVASLLMGGVANGAVPVAFTVSGGTFQVGASQLEGTGFSQYAGVAKEKDGKTHPVSVANIASAKLYDLCQSVVVPGMPLGLKITAGGGGTPATATDLQIGMTDLKGDATFNNIRIGVDASTVSTTAKGTAGDFAQDADSVSIKNLQQTAWSTQASVFNLTGLHLQLTNGETCF